MEGLLQRALAWNPKERQAHLISFLRELELAGTEPTLNSSPKTKVKSERRARQRQQQKQIEQQRRQHASQALLYLQAKVCEARAKPKTIPSTERGIWDDSVRYLQKLSRGVNDLA